jgi:hypothetical protein
MKINKLKFKPILLLFVLFYSLMTDAQPVEKKKDEFTEEEPKW